MVVFGVITLVSAVSAVALTHAGLRTRRGPVVTCDRLARAGRRATVRGVVEPLPDGLVFAPVSGRACVWFTSTVVCHWIERDRDRVRDFDGDGPLHHTELRPVRRGRGRPETLSSQRPFLLRDDTGAVLVDPAGLRAIRLPASVRDTVGGGVPHDGVVAVDFASGARRTRHASRYERTEILLLPGETVFLRGPVTHHPDGTATLGGRSSTVSLRRAGTPRGPRRP